MMTDNDYARECPRDGAGCRYCMLHDYTGDCMLSPYSQALRVLDAVERDPKGKEYREDILVALGGESALRFAAAYGQYCRERKAQQDLDKKFGRH